MAVQIGDTILSTLVVDCPRCGAKEHTLDVKAADWIKESHNWQQNYEVYGTCRRCKRGTIFGIEQKELGDIYNSKGLSNADGLIKTQETLNAYFRIRGYVSLKDEQKFSSPEHVPSEITVPFDEGATCLAVQCWNAAGAMFRVCLDNATRDLLPAEDPPGMNKRARYDLGLRLQWLFDQSLLASDLKKLATCIHQDGNDGAHRGNLTKEDAEDLLDFTVALLERLYTEPARVAEMEARRAARRTPKS